jgi:hypothetical protein
MTPQDKQNLRALRDDMEDTADKQLLRRVVNHIHVLEAKLHSIRTLTRAISNEAKITPAMNEEQD